MDRILKRKITQRWEIISRGTLAGPAAKAFAQLEYILLEAGLLARPRAPRRQKKLPELSLDETGDNTMSLSEEIGRNYAE